MKKSPLHLAQDGSFVIENYQQAKSFADFFPGVAGVWGIPMWVFFVNRGQGIASFGIESKDKAILEFQPANKAYRMTSTHGFRTFLKVKKGKTEKFYEPFRNSLVSPFKVTQTMKITSHDLTIEEINTTLGLSVTVNYFTVPEEPFSGLTRSVTVKNISRGDMGIDMIDGLPVVTPYGQNDWIMKHMCRTIEAWYKVRNMDQKAPYYQLNVDAADVAEVKHVKEGNFYFSFDPKAKPGTLLAPLVNPLAVFGQSTDFLVPEVFIQDKNFTVPKVQHTDSRTPCAMSRVAFKLKGNGKKEIVSLIGFVHSVDELNATVKSVTTKGFIAEKRQKNKELVNGIKALSFTKSASQEFDAYAGQTFLDNVLRGGLPISLQTGEGPAVFNVYSRKHGDLERDYNFFRLSPTFLSQGNGNFRDVNQNRRNDVWFNSDLKDNAVMNFYSLSQADGYNPLVVCGMMFVAEDTEAVNEILNKYLKTNHKDALKSFLQKGFMPGDLFRFMQDKGIKLKCSEQEFLGHILGCCQKAETAEHGEGFWSDHWTYNLDLVESYLGLYPEKLRNLLFEKKECSFYHNSTYVLPRDQRYVLTDRGVRQYESLHEGKEDAEGGKKLRVRGGAGEVYYTSLIVKMLCLLANKVATFDPSGVGIEMEAGKPNWYDSLNGLPGLLGSAISETFEVKRAAQFLLDALDSLDVSDEETIDVFEELYDFISGLAPLLERVKSPLEYWKKSNNVKEMYRERVRAGIVGVESEMEIGDIRSFLTTIVAKGNQAVEEVASKSGIFPTYFCHKVTKYEHINAQEEGQTGSHVRPLEFERHDLPLFLEGFVHALRSEKDADKALKLHKAVRASALFDKKLQMYKVNADLTSESEEIGRTRVFPRGWLENESVWLHMEYKYLLELIRRGLHEEFYLALETCCVAFLDPQVYGRSILENSSFISSSAHPDKDFHGQGFVARLSGSTAEFVHIWMYMNAGISPFILGPNGNLQFALVPALRGKLFLADKERATYVTSEGKDQLIALDKGDYVFNFMGKVMVVYHNPLRKDTFGEKGVKVVKYTLQYARDKKSKEVLGSVLTASLAEDIRSGKVVRMDVDLA